MKHRPATWPGNPPRACVTVHSARRNNNPLEATTAPTTNTATVRTQVPLRSIRQAAGLSQGALALRAGISEKAIGALERGDRTTPRLATVVLLAQALNASPAEREQMLAAARGEPHSAAQVDVHSAGHGLFAPPTPLIGRQAEVAAARRLLLPSDGTARLLTLIGAG
jgi:transcriptional regulator with XRE-family HTH domain